MNSAHGQRSKKFDYKIRNDADAGKTRQFFYGYVQIAHFILKFFVKFHIDRRKSDNANV